jgi:hypothetical protein
MLFKDSKFILALDVKRTAGKRGNDNERLHQRVVLKSVAALMIIRD